MHCSNRAVSLVCRLQACCPAAPSEQHDQGEARRNDEVALLTGGVWHVAWLLPQCDAQRCVSLSLMPVSDE